MSIDCRQEIKGDLIRKFRATLHAISRIKISLDFLIFRQYSLNFELTFGYCRLKKFLNKKLFSIILRQQRLQVMHFYAVMRFYALYLLHQFRFRSRFYASDHDVFRCVFTRNKFEHFCFVTVRLHNQGA